jgi:hypothetical protein
MFICAAGDIHGAMDRLYENVIAFETLLGIRFDQVLHVGDFGIWPDPARVDRATRHHEGAGDFPVWLRENRGVPRATVFIKGNHEDFLWLDARQDAEVLPGLTYLPNGCAIDIEDRGGGSIRVGGVGGCYGPSDYLRRSELLQGYAKRHYTGDEIKRLAVVGVVDIVLTHDAPAGVRFERHRRVVLPRNRPPKVIEILKTSLSSLRVHRVDEVGYAFLDAQSRLGTAQVGTHPAGGHQ